MAEEQSLAAQTGTLTASPKFEVPSVFMEPQDKVVGRFAAPYISFAHKERPDEYGKLVGQFGVVNEGDMFLVEGNKVTKLDTAKLSVLKVKQYWVEKDASGKVLKASYTEMPYPWAEHMDVVVLVYLPDRITVANVNPHTTKCGGFKTLADALEECQKPEWGDKSPAHRATLQINQPFMRFFGELTVASPQTSKRTGRPYRTTPCVIRPVTNVEVELLGTFSRSEEGAKQMKDAAERYSFRISEVESKLVGK